MAASDWHAWLNSFHFSSASYSCVDEKYLRFSVIHHRFIVVVVTHLHIIYFHCFPYRISFK